MAKKKREDAPAQQSKRLIDMARELGVDESEAAQQRAFRRIGLKSPAKRAPRKK